MRFLSQVFDDRGEVIYFLDGGSDSHPTSWLSCVQCARTDREQNLEITQTNTHIFYRAIKVLCEVHFISYVLRVYFSIFKIENDEIKTGWILKYFCCRIFLPRKSCWYGMGRTVCITWVFLWRHITQVKVCNFFTLFQGLLGNYWDIHSYSFGKIYKRLKIHKNVNQDKIY